MLPLLSFLSLGLPLAAASSSPEPCAEITKLVQNANTTAGSTSFTVPFELAEGCLESMPFDPELAGAFLDELEKYVEWQSTIEALKYPPNTYNSASFDILGSLAKVRDTKFGSQWEFDQAISSIVKSANDGHFSISLCSFIPFGFLRPGLPLVSVSTDGLETPQLYLAADARYLNNSAVKVSPVVTINGEDANSYLSDIAELQPLQDPDARYNYLFQYAAGAGQFVQDLVYQDGKSITKLGFRNGSTIEVQNTAVVKDLKFAAENGEELFDLYCRPQPAKEEPAGEEETPSEPEPLKTGPVGYPEPLLRDPWSVMNGYYLDDETAVMYIPTFDGSEYPQNHSVVFANYATQFVLQAQADGLTKLIIDVTNNPGGTIVRAFDLFKLFFPDEFPYSATRFRRHEASVTLTKVYSKANATIADGTPLAYSGQVTPDQEGDFGSYEELLGNETELGVKVSALFANFNYTTTAAEGTNPIRGYAGIPLTKQPFKPEDILIVGNGACSSTCTTFVNLMTNVGGVRSLTFGGQPDKGPMQIMGGVRGAQSASFDLISEFVTTAVKLVDEAPEKFDFIPDEEYAHLLEIAPVPLANFPIVVKSGNVNFRNAYQEGADHTPLQFEYQASDCRLYYTAENIFQPETTWFAAKEAAWGNGACVKDSTGARGCLKYKEGKKQ